MEQSQLERQPKVPGLTMIDLLNLPDSERHLINWIRRNAGCTLTEIAAYLNNDETIALALLNDLLVRGYVRQVEESGKHGYRVQIASLQRRQIPSKIRQLAD